MSGLLAYLPDSVQKVLGDSGLVSKPITDGTPVVVNEAQAQGESGFWSGLDDLGDKAWAALGSLATAAAEGKASELRGDSRASDTTGSAQDQPGGGVAADEPFVKKYKTELMLAGGVLLSLGVLYWVTKG